MNALGFTMGRKVELSNAAPKRHIGLRVAANNLSLRNVDQATCELMNEGLCRLVAVCYEEDAGGLCNLDFATGRVLVAVPWGRNGQAKWGLRPQEANILRQILFDWEQSGLTLLNYDRTRKSWFVNLRDFGNYHLAKQWLTQRQITIGVYRTARAKRLDGA